MKNLPEFVKDCPPEWEKEEEKLEEVFRRLTNKK